MSNDKIIHFPTNRIVTQRSRELDEQRKKQTDKVLKEIEKQQTKKFVETAVDDISMGLLRQFVDLAIKTEKPSFTKDLALLVDVMRGMIYRDFNLPHPAQLLSDELVDLKTSRNNNVTAKIDYTKVLKTNIKPSKPISTDVKNELNDLNNSIQGVQFDGDEIDD